MNETKRRCYMTYQCMQFGPKMLLDVVVLRTSCLWCLDAERTFLSKRRKAAPQPGSNVQPAAARAARDVRHAPTRRDSRAPAMTPEGCGSRVLRALQQAALWLRNPACRLLGSVRAAVGLLSVLVGGYTLIIASLYISDMWYYSSARILLTTTAAFAHITAIMNIALLFGILLKKKIVLQYIVCAAMALYAICMPLSFSAIIVGFVDGYIDQAALETPRIALCLLHLGLMYCLLVELRSELSAEGPTPSHTEGWLKNNLAQQGTPPVSGEEVLLKVDSVPNSGHAHPTYFAPMNAVPVHHAPASYGPLSSSEA